MKKGDIVGGTLELGRNLTLSVALLVTGMTLAKSDFMQWSNALRFFTAVCSLIAGVILMVMAVVRFLEVSFPTIPVNGSKIKRLFLASALAILFSVCANLILAAVTKTVAHAHAVSVCNNPRFTQDQVIQSSKECLDLREIEEAQRKRFHEREANRK